MEKILVIIEDRADLNALKEILSNKNAGQFYRVFSWDPDIGKKIPGWGAEYSDFTGYINSNSKIYVEQFRGAVEIISRFSKFSVEGAALEDFLAVDGVSLWEAAKAQAVIYTLPPLVRYIDLINELIKSEQPQKIIIGSQESSFLKLFGQIARSHSIAVSHLGCISLSSWLKEICRPFLLPLLKGAVFWLKLLRRATFAIKSAPGGKKNILFLISTHWQTRAFASVIQVLKNNSDKCLRIIFSRKSPDLLKFKQEGIASHFYKEYLNLQVLGKIRRTHSYCKKLWAAVTECEKDLKSICYKDIPLWDFIKTDLEYFFFNHIKPISLNLELAKVVLKEEKPFLLIYSDEFDIFLRILILLAKKQSIPVLRMQYGTVGFYAPDWVFCLADKIAVSGEGIKQVLVGNGLSAAAISVTGMPRFDNLVNKQFSATEFKNRLGFLENKKIILFTSISHSKDYLSENEGSFTKSEYLIWLKEIYQACDALDEVYVIVKPHHHPRDPIAIHEQIINKLKHPDKFKLVSINEDVTELIRGSDILITWESTSALEAIALTRPVVIVNLTGRPDEIPYVANGAAFGAYQKEDILSILQKALNDRQAQLELSQGQGRFQQEWLYQIDGLASERIAELIKQLETNKF